MSRSFRRLALVAGLILACSTLAACARPVGDFGRASPSVLHDEIMPAAGRARVKAAGEPVSGFNLADEEREMHDRVWRFLTAPHARDWFMDTAVELRRTRLAGAGTTAQFDPRRYHAWLRERDYASSRVRYRTVADHALADIGTAPATFAVICDVIELDRRRGLASAELGGLTHRDVVARRAENLATIGWFTQALRYRHDAYAAALDRLLVETPHPEAREVEMRLGELVVHVEAAERGDFCGGARVYSGKDARQEALPSRLLMRQGDPDYRK